MQRAVFAYKESHGCADCGQFFPHFVMEFDHCRGPKAGNVSTLAHSWGLTRLMAEIEKCDLVCANCHRFRTHARGMSQPVTAPA